HPDRRPVCWLAHQRAQEYVVLEWVEHESLTPFCRIEDALMLENGIAIRHSSDVVGNGTREAALAGFGALLIGDALVFDWHEFRRGEKSVEEILYHFACLRRHPEHTIVTIHLLSKIALELQMLCRDSLAQTNERLGLPTDRLDTLRPNCVERRK